MREILRFLSYRQLRGLLSILFRLPKYIRLSWRLMKDPQVPLRGKIIVILVTLYVISPIDLIPEIMIPHLGFAEDFLFFLLAIQYMIRVAPLDIVTRHAREIALETSEKS